MLKIETLSIHLQLSVLLFQVLALFQNTSQSLLFPEPVGPYYGTAYSTKVAKRLLFPSTAYGKCKEGTSYTINSPNDLRSYDTELQCIFNAGLTPSKIPEGPQYPGLLLTFNARHFLIHPIYSFFWKGNFVFKAECNATDSRGNGRNASEIHIAFYNSRYRAISPTLVHISPLKGNFAAGEHEDGKASVIMDFRKDLSRLCPDYGDFVTRNGSNLPTRVRNLRIFYPDSKIVDVYRLVGRQNDGGRIYLGKAYFQDYYRSDEQMATIAFWYLVNYDDEVNPEFGAGQPLPPLEASFDYMFPGIRDFFLRVLPFDNFASRPVATLGKLGRGIIRTGRTTWSYIRDFLRSLGSRRRDRQRLREYFKNKSSSKKSEITPQVTTTTAFPSTSGSPSIQDANPMSIISTTVKLIYETTDSTESTTDPISSDNKFKDYEISPIDIR